MIALAASYLVLCTGDESRSSLTDGLPAVLPAYLHLTLLAHSENVRNFTP